MSPLRFETARDLFDAFPIAQDEINVEPSDQPPLEFLKSLLAAGTLDKAVGFCAYLLPRREAVWWGCHCIRIMVPNRVSEEDACLRTAETWVMEPEEDRRIAALDLGTRGNQQSPTTWLALAAGWSGGSTNPKVEGSPLVLPYQTARAVRVAVLIGGSRCEPAQRSQLLRKCIQDGARFAAGQEL